MEDPLVVPFAKACAASRLDPVALAQDLHDITRTQAIGAFSGRENPQFAALELETRLWDLVARLAANVGNPGMDTAAAQLDWAEQNMQAPQEPANLQHLKWLYTASKHDPATISELDDDAPLRQHRGLAPEDAAADEAFFKYVFELLLAGETELALKAAADTNNWFVSIAISTKKHRSGDGSGSAAVDAAGRELARASTGSKYEAGVYGLLYGDLEVVAPLCTSWEMLLLAYLNARVPLSAFEQAVASNHIIALQGTDSRRQVVLALLRNQFDEFVDRLVAEVNNAVRDGDDNESGASGSSTEPLLVQHPWLVRVLLHAQLALGKPANEMLLEVYVEYLCSDPDTVAERVPLVPEYVRFLSKEAMTRVYGWVLAQISLPEGRAQQIALAREYGLPLRGALDRAVDLNFSLYESSVDSTRLVAALHWFIDAGEWPDAVTSLVRAYRTFFENGDRSAAQNLSRSVHTDAVRRKALDATRAHLHEYPELVPDLQALRQYSELASAFWGLSLAGDPSRTSPTLIGSTIELVSSALSFSGPEELRRRYVPQLVFELLGVLLQEAAAEGNRRYARTALDLATRISDERARLYALFEHGQLQKLMGVFAEAHLTAIEA